MKLGAIFSSKQPIPVSQPNLITKQSLAERTKMPGDVRLLDQDAREKGFKPSTIMNIYRQARDCHDNELKTAMEKRSGTQFVAIKEDRSTGKMNYSLSLTKLNEGKNHEIFLEITSTQGCLVASVPKKEENLLHRPPELEYHRVLKGCSNIIQVKDYANGRCYLERAKGDFTTLPDQIDNAPQLIKGLLRGGVQMAQGKVMHLDLKFDNILIGMDGEPKFTDFEMASSVNADGMAIERCATGNLLHYSPERHLYALCSLDEKCLPSEFNLGLQDNVWGQMILICRLDRKSTTPWCQLNGAFQDRFDDLIALFNKAHEEGLKAGKNWSDAFLEEVHEHMINGLKKYSEGNIFGGLIPQTPLEDLVKRMAETDPKKRISIHKAVQLFELAERNPTGYFEEAAKLYNETTTLQDSCNFSSSPKQETSSSSSDTSPAHSQSKDSSDEIFSMDRFSSGSSIDLQTSVS